MTPEQFTYWLQGYAEINGAPPNDQQWAVIRDHLKLVFDKRTPDRGAQPASNPAPFGPSPFGNPPWGTPNVAPDLNGKPHPLQPLRAECKSPPSGATVIC